MDRYRERERETERKREPWCIVHMVMRRCLTYAALATGITTALSLKATRVSRSRAWNESRAVAFASLRASAGTASRARAFQSAIAIGRAYANDRPSIPRALAVVKRTRRGDWLLAFPRYAYAYASESATSVRREMDTSVPSARKSPPRSSTATDNDPLSSRMNSPSLRSSSFVRGPSRVQRA